MTAPRAPAAAAARGAGVRSTDSAEVVLPNSYHVATLDNDAEEIFSGSVEFIRRLSA